MYRQKYATYQLNNRTFSTQNTKIRLARNQLHMFSGIRILFIKKKKKKKKKPLLSTTTENLVTPAPSAPDKGSIREIATGEITLSITPGDHLEGPYLLKTREFPGLSPCTPPGALRRAPAILDPTRMRRIACFRHTQTLACSQSFIIAFSRVSGRYVKHFSDAKVQTFWLALSVRSISLFSSFLFLMNIITSVTNTVMDILYRQTVINQQCILRFEKNRMFSTQIF